ncbi:hypothetical protein [uncultured Bosea sp.]|uniref:hypothetical protein n=1 Tax=uncultured Bosea sp. TaxID=211457 RepID=UPI0025F4A06F|nr:hypothetical protein [uncultured Bosea sp.]
MIQSALTPDNLGRPAPSTSAFAFILSSALEKALDHRIAALTAEFPARAREERRADYEPKLTDIDF